MPDSTLAELRATVVTRYPELSGARFTLHTKGWDSLAVDADDRLIFKFPRDADAEASLRLETRLLAIVRPAVAMPVPDLTLVDGPPLFSRHTKLQGEHLVATDYARLPSRDRDELADALGLFYTQLHALDHDAMRAAGARRVYAWLGPDAIRAKAWPLLPGALRPLADRTLGIWQDLPPDPHGETYGYFDGHGWNMAFDHANGRLNGIYDFGDSGFGDVHQEFVYSNFISNDLTARIVAAYERHARRELDRARIDALTGAFRLHELAKADDDRTHLAFSLDQFATWASWPR